MSYFGINRAVKPAPLYKQVYIDRNERPKSETDQRPLRVTYNGPVPTTKWQGTANPIEQERKTKQLEPPPLWKSTMRERKYGRYYEEASRATDPQLRQALMQAIAAQEKIDLEQQVNSEINQETVNRFQAWLMGLGKPSDHQKAGWWPKNSGRPRWLKQNNPISQHPSVLKYLEQFTEQKVNYEKELAKLKMDTSRVRNLPIERLWEIYKFYVLGMDPKDVIDNHINMYESFDKHALTELNAAKEMEQKEYEQKPMYEKDYQIHLLNTLKEQNALYQTLINRLSLQGTPVSPPPITGSVSLENATQASAQAVQEAASHAMSEESVTPVMEQRSEAAEETKNLRHAEKMRLAHMQEKETERRHRETLYAQKNIAEEQKATSSKLLAHGKSQLQLLEHIFKGQGKLQEHLKNLKQTHGEIGEKIDTHLTRLSKDPAWVQLKDEIGSELKQLNKLHLQHVEHIGRMAKAATEEHRNLAVFVGALQETMKSTGTSFQQHHLQMENLRKDLDSIKNIMKTESAEQLKALSFNHTTMKNLHMWMEHIFKETKALNETALATRSLDKIENVIKTQMASIQHIMVQQTNFTSNELREIVNVLRNEEALTASKIVHALQHIQQPHLDNTTLQLLRADLARLTATVQSRVSPGMALEIGPSILDAADSIINYAMPPAEKYPIVRVTGDIKSNEPPTVEMTESKQKQTQPEKIYMSAEMYQQWKDAVTKSESGESAPPLYDMMDETSVRWAKTLREAIKNNLEEFSAVWKKLGNAQLTITQLRDVIEATGIDFSTVYQLFPQLHEMFEGVEPLQTRGFRNIPKQPELSEETKLMNSVIESLQKTIKGATQHEAKHRGNLIHAALRGYTDEKGKHVLPTAKDVHNILRLTKDESMMEKLKALQNLMEARRETRERMIGFWKYFQSDYMYQYVSNRGTTWKYSWKDKKSYKVEK